MLDASQIELLKRNIDNLVDIETQAGEKLVAKVVFVTHCDEYDEHDLLYTMVSSNMPESYKDRETIGGYVFDFDEIISVKLHDAGSS